MRDKDLKNKVADENKQLRNKLKKYRFNQDELDQIEFVSKNQNMTRTDFFRHAISEEIKKNHYHVLTEADIKKYCVFNVKYLYVYVKKIETVTRYEKIDPDLLFEISKIGNNINQIAKTLHQINNNKSSATDINYLFVLQALSEMQNTLHLITKDL
jgi:vacuolar-type H+-ATPase catalytic subunit A/Vma1